MKSYRLLRSLGESLVCISFAVLSSIGAQAQIPGSDDAEKTAAFETAITDQLPTAVSNAKLADVMQLHPSPVVFSPTVTHVTIWIVNPLDSAATVDLAVRFSYPRVDSTGTLVPDSSGTRDAALAHDMSRWITGFSPHVTIAPHDTQWVTLALAVPPGTRDGEYWATFVATARHVALRYFKFLHLPPAPPGVQANPIPIRADLATTLPLLYRQGTLATALHLQHAPSTTLLGDSLLRVCVPLHLSGTAHADGLLRVSISSRQATDRAVAVPLPVYEDMTPCVALNLRSLPPGQYRVAVRVTSDRNNVPVAARLRLTPMRATSTFDLSATARRAAEATRVRDTTQDLSDSVFSQVTLAGKDGPLRIQLADEAAKAAALGRTPVLDVGAAWCGACHVLARLIRLPAMRETMRDMYVIHVDADEVGAMLNALGVPTMSLPILVAIGRDGKPTKERSPGFPDNPRDTAAVPATSSDIEMIRTVRPELTRFFMAARAGFARGDVAR